MQLSSSQRRFLKSRAHHLQPCVQIGNNGVTPGLIAELDQQLAHHELIKIKIRAQGREQRDSLIAELLSSSGASFVNRVGHVAILYRPRPNNPALRLPA